MDKNYCCSTFADAVENWGGVELQEDGYYMIDVFDEGWHKIEKCPWCFARLTLPESEK